MNKRFCFLFLFISVSFISFAKAKFNKDGYSFSKFSCSMSLSEENRRALKRAVSSSLQNGELLTKSVANGAGVSAKIAKDFSIQYLVAPTLGLASGVLGGVILIGHGCKDGLPEVACLLLSPDCHCPKQNIFSKIFNGAVSIPFILKSGLVCYVLVTGFNIYKPGLKFLFKSLHKYGYKPIYNYAYESDTQALGKLARLAVRSGGSELPL